MNISRTSSRGLGKVIADHTIGEMETKRQTMETGAMEVENGADARN